MQLIFIDARYFQYAGYMEHSVTHELFASLLSVLRPASAARYGITCA